MNYRYLLLLVFFLTSCAATRVTTTEHSAVEQALLTYTSRKAFSSVDFSTLAGKKIFIKEVILPHRFQKASFANSNYWHEINPEYLKSVLQKKLLLAGVSVVDMPEQAEIMLELHCDIAAIDDSEFVMGIPSIPIPIATGGGASLQTPEISLFSSKRQTGKVRFSVFGKDKETGALAFFKKSKAAKKYYSRWSMLIILGWRVTDLGKPF